MLVLTWQLDEQTLSTCLSLDHIYVEIDGSEHENRHIVTLNIADGLCTSVHIRREYAVHLSAD